MARRRHTPKQIITMLREAEVALAQVQSVAQVCKRLEVAEQTDSVRSQTTEHNEEKYPLIDSL